MSWWDSIVDVAGDVYDGAVEFVGEQYDSYTEYQKTVQSEAAKDADALRANEPVKGSLVDGSPVVADAGATGSASSALISNQLIAGVDNKWLVIGGLVAALVLLKK